MKFLLLMLITAVLVTFGCASGPLPEKAAWPWEYGKEYGNNQTGDFFTYRGSVANFGKPPEAVKPVNLDPVPADNPEPKPAPASTVTPQTPPLRGFIETSSSDARRNAVGTYDFMVRDIRITPPDYLAIESAASTYDITAFNQGNAPVSVIIGTDQGSSRNFSTDKVLPVRLVVPPKSDRILLTVKPKKEGYSFTHQYSWEIGDFTAAHTCPEGYLLPFGENVEVFAQVTETATATPYTRHALIFAMPAATPVRTARKGTVVRTRKDKVDILHDDSTVATYGHLGRIANGIVPGKTVVAGDTIGTVGLAADGREGYMQLTVWRPEMPAHSPELTVQYVSFPIEFCTGKNCRVITKDQLLPRQASGKVKRTSQSKKTVQRQ